MKKKIPITYSKERVVLSDVLPYETPLTFSNRYFYNYLITKRKYENDAKRKAKYKAATQIENILFGTSDMNTPFSFNIKHKENDFRQLSIIHPKNQHQVLQFYNDYKDLILYYSSISPYSIRKPYKIAKFVFYNDILHKRTNDNNLNHSLIEQEDSEYENLRSFFTYYKYNNIHKFYESYQFHRCEKKYNKLLKIDISKCFDSVYTHTISWALFNKSIVKDNIPKSRQTFAGEFDELMQRLNDNETNGIVIGPEFSRIFAELILQQIDKNIFNTLQIKDDLGKNLVHKVDYEIFRYVDDYFIFFKDDHDKEKILREFKLALKDYKMYINESKCIIYEKPIITEISMAKQRISDLFNDHLFLKIDIQESKDDDNDQPKQNIYFSANNVITRFKTIIKDTGIDYKDILNYSLAVLDKKAAKLIKKYKSLSDDEKKEYKIEQQFVKGFLEILDVAFFLYSVSPRVNSTIKICLIVDKIKTFVRKNRSNNFISPFNSNNKHTILKKIADDIFLVLQKNKSNKETQIETLYLLIALAQLGREYKLDTKVLCSFFNIKSSKKGYEFEIPLNYFSITVLLFYIKGADKYSGIKNALKQHILDKYNLSEKDSWNSKTELILLLLDVITCPYLDEEVSDHLKNKYKAAIARKSKSLKNYRNEILCAKYSFKLKLIDKFGITDNKIALIEQEKYWFTKWTNFDFGMELQAKRSQEVY